MIPASCTWDFETDEIDVTDLPGREWQRLPGAACAVYRFYNATGTRIYVGISSSPVIRFQQHRRDSWAHEVHRKTVVWYRTRTEAQSVETVVIITERPPHNVRNDLPMPVITEHRQTSEGGNCMKSYTAGNARLLMREILSAVEDGEHVMITRHNTPTAVVVPDEWFRRARTALGEDDQQDLAAGTRGTEDPS